MRPMLREVALRDGLRRAAGDSCTNGCYEAEAYLQYSILPKVPWLSAQREGSHVYAVQDPHLLVLVVLQVPGSTYSWPFSITESEQMLIPIRKALQETTKKERFLLAIYLPALDPCLPHLPELPDLSDSHLSTACWPLPRYESLQPLCPYLHLLGLHDSTVHRSPPSGFHMARVLLNDN